MKTVKLKENLVKSLVQKNVIKCLIMLINCDPKAPKDFLKDSLRLGETTDIDLLINLLPDDIKDIYKTTAGTLEQHFEMAVLEYDVKLLNLYYMKPLKEE